MSARTFGIDLGTTCSAIGFVDAGRPRLVPVDGDVLVPSVVSFPAEGPPLVGRPALNRLALDPERTIRSAKRHMGSEHRWLIGEREVAPHEVGALVLGRLADAAGELLGERAHQVVITVPAWFTQAQRADTRRAAEAAELEPVRLINEPTAAALAHAHGRSLVRRALVYDFGGGTFDASLVEQDGALVEVRASHGDTRLGGDDLDRELAGIALARLGERDPPLAAAVRASAAAQARLVLAVQEVKHELSWTLRAGLRVPFLLEVDGESRHLEDELDRQELERAARPLVERTLASVEQVLRDAGVEPGQVDELLLVGGSTRMPIVWDRLRERFGWEGSTAVEPDRAVALGAAIQAALVDGSRVDGVLVDVAPWSLSVAALDHSLDGETRMICEVVTPRNAPIPSRHARLFHTAAPFQDTVKIPVFQGSDRNPLRNVALGEIVMSGLPPAPSRRETRPIGVQFLHDLDGMVSIRVTDELSGRTVDGRVAADGVEVAELRDALVLELREQEVLPGDGTDPDPFLELEAPEDDTAEPALELVPVPPRSDLEEACQAFATLLSREDDLAREHPGRVLELRRLASAGMDSAQAGDEGAALARYDELTDILFELGVYL